MASVDAFARSVPADRLHTVATELGKAFDGQGDNLQAVVDSLNAFTGRRRMRCRRRST